MPVDAPTLPSLSDELAHRVEGFESALTHDPTTDLGRFLPARGHPLYLAVLTELIRVDMEHAWAAGRPRRASDYAARFPAVYENPELLNGIAFEEYRQRRSRGEAACPKEYRVIYGINTDDWPQFGSTPTPEEDDLPRTFIAQTPPPPLLDEISRTVAPPAASDAPPSGGSAGRTSTPAEEDWESAGSVSRLQEAVESLPKPGTEFLGFVLMEELGRGAFGRVYLARQGVLAGRLVVLKVACDISAESRTLAQLQHPNIVPVYSLHKAGPFQAVCMPYCGRITLAQVLKQLCDRPSLPSSGRELKSTLNVRKDP